MFMSVPATAVSTWRKPVMSKMTTCARWAWAPSSAVVSTRWRAPCPMVPMSGMTMISGAIGMRRRRHFQKVRLLGTNDLILSRVRSCSMARRSCSSAFALCSSSFASCWFTALSCSLRWSRC